MELIATPFGWIMSLLYSFVQNYGWTLIAFTIFIRAISFPINMKTQKSTARQALLQPKYEQLKKKYGKDKQRHQQEMMRLQEEEGVSPFSSCLPMIIQFVLLFAIIEVVYNPLRYVLSIPKSVVTQAIALFEQQPRGVELEIINIVQGNHLTASPELQGQITQIMSPYLDKIQDFQLNFLGVNLGQNPTLGWNLTVLIPILSGVTSMLVSLMMLRNQKKTKMNQQAGAGAMNGMMYIMPVFSAWIAFTFPMGMGLYWIIGNFCMLFTNFILYRIYTPEKMQAIADEEKKNRKDKKPSRYRQMMNDAVGKQTQDKRVGAIVEVEGEEVDASATDGQDPDHLSDSQKVALARKRMAELYGED